MRRKALFVMAGVITAASSWAVAVNVPVDGVTLNLGLYLRAGHYYEFYDYENVNRPESQFFVDPADLRVYGKLWDVVDYNVRGGFNTTITEAYLTAAFPAGFRVTLGRAFVPFGNEATTQEWDLVTNYKTATTYNIARGRDTGLRVDWRLERGAWPYLVGAAAGGYISHELTPVVDGASRVFGTPLPAVKTFVVGFSYLYAKEQRRFGYYDYNERYLEAPRAGGDLSYDVWRLKFRAEYMQYFINEYIIYTESPYNFYYKDDFRRGLFGAASYTQPLPWKYLQGFEPYARYERYDPAVLRRGDIPEDRYTAGFALHFVGQNLMFRSDYTRILEDRYRTSNDEIASAFQVFF